MNSRGDQLNGRTRKLLDMVDILLAIKVFIVDAMGEKLSPFRWYFKEKRTVYAELTTGLC